MVNQENRHLSDLLEAFGDYFVRWVLNLPDQDGPIASDAELTPEQAVGVAGLITQARAVLASPNPLQRNLARRTLLSASLNSPIEESPISAIREYCGGSLPEVDSSDWPEHLLLKTVRDAFPLSLISEEPTSPGLHASLGPLTLGLKSSSDLADSILADESLKLLFPDTTTDDLTSANRYNIQSYLKWGSGNGGSYQLVMVPDALVSYALTLGAIRQPYSIDHAMTAAREALSLARRLARGEEASVPLIADIENVDLGTVQYVDFGDGGILYPPRSTDASSSAIVFVTPVTEQVQQITGFGPGSDFSAIERTWSETEERSLRDRYLEVSRRLDGVRLAMILSSPLDQVVSPIIGKWSRLNPLNYMSPTYNVRESSQVVPFERVTLSSDDRMNIIWWLSRLRSISTASMDIGIRRLIAAVTARIDPLDGFIDAVMCWENLFSGTPETSFRVCGSIAKLLEPSNSEARSKLFRDAKKLYTERSTLVHGGGEPKPEKRDQLRNSAVRIAIRSLVAALQDDDLLARETSSARAQHILVEI